MRAQVFDQGSQGVTSRRGSQLLKRGRKGHHIGDEAIKQSISIAQSILRCYDSHGQLLDNLPKAIVIVDVRQLVIAVIPPKWRRSPRHGVCLGQRTRFNA